MEDILTIIDYYVKNGSRLGSGIDKEEAYILAENLRNRINGSSNQLDFSPASLELLTNLLNNYIGNKRKIGEQLLDEEIMKIVREIASYLGLVFIHNSKSTWNSGKSFYGLQIDIKKESKVKKNNNTLSNQEIGVPLFFPSATFLMMLQKGKIPDLHSFYQNAIKTKIKEKI
jgi:hypothetical protein